MSRPPIPLSELYTEHWLCYTICTKTAPIVLMRFHSVSPSFISNYHFSKRDSFSYIWRCVECSTKAQTRTTNRCVLCVCVCVCSSVKSNHSCHRLRLRAQHRRSSDARRYVVPPIQVTAHRSRKRVSAFSDHAFGCCARFRMFVSAYVRACEPATCLSAHHQAHPTCNVSPCRIIPPERS